MDRFRKLLVVADDAGQESPAYAWAIELARRSGAEVTLADSLDLYRAELGGWTVTQSRRELDDLRVEARQNELEAVIEPARREGIRARALVLEGTAFLEIIREVLRNGHDLVLRTANPPDGFARLFTSFDMHLLRKCPCPVWIAAPGPRPGSPGRPRRILAAVDPSVDDQEQRDLDRLTMDLASSLATPDGELHVVHAWTLLGEGMLRSGRHGLKTVEVERMVAEERERRSIRLDRLLAQLPSGGAVPSIHLVKGRASEAVPAVAKRISADLIVMGTVARTGIPGFIMGNTAEDILNRMTCSVLAVKPRSFVSPVQLPKSSRGVVRSRGKATI